MKKHGFEAVESENGKEKAEALGRAGERLECALQALESFRRELLVLIANRPDDPLNEDGGVPPDIQEKIAEHTRLEEQARQLRYCLIIQREAMGSGRP